MPNQAKSQVLISALILLMITLGIGAVVLLFSRSAREATRQQLDKEKACSLANSCLERTIYCIKNNPTNFDTVCKGSFSLGEGSFSAIPIKVDSGVAVKAEITCTGKVGTSSSSLKDSLVLSAVPPSPSVGWAKVYYDTLDYNEQIYSIQQSNDGGYIACGARTYLGSCGYMLLLKTDGNGNITAGNCGASQACFAKLIGGAAGIYEYQDCNAARQVDDGGYLFTGWTASGDIVTGRSATDGLVIKTDDQGKLSGGKCGTTQACWAKTFGVSKKDDQFYSGEQTRDGGYIFSGFTMIDANRGFLVVKTDDQGNLSGGKCGITQSCWAYAYRCTAGTDFDQRALTNVVQTFPDDGYIVAGKLGTSQFGSYDVMALKLDAQGNKVWAHLYGSSNSEEPFEIKQASDGGYVLVGYTGGGSFIIKTDDQGNLSNGNCGINQTCWGKLYNLPYIKAIEELPDKSYLVTGEGNSEIFLLKLNSDGSLNWLRAKNYGGTGIEECDSLELTTDGGYIFGGLTRSFTGLTGHSGNKNDNFLVKTDSSGDISSCNIIKDLNVTSSALVFQDSATLTIETTNKTSSGLIAVSHTLNEPSSATEVANVCPQ